MYDIEVIAERLSGDDAYVAAMLNNSSPGLIARDPHDVLWIALTSPNVTADSACSYLENISYEVNHRQTGITPDDLHSIISRFKSGFEGTQRWNDLAVSIIVAALEVACPDDEDGYLHERLFNFAFDVLRSFPANSQTALESARELRSIELSYLPPKFAEPLIEWLLAVAFTVGINKNDDMGDVIIASLVKSTGNDTHLSTYFDLLEKAGTPRSEILTDYSLGHAIGEVVGEGGWLAYEHIRANEWDEWDAHRVFQSKYTDRLTDLAHLMLNDSDAPKNVSMFPLAHLMRHGDPDETMNTYESLIGQVFEGTDYEGFYYGPTAQCVTFVLNTIIKHGNVGWLLWAWDYRNVLDEFDKNKDRPAEEVFFAELSRRVASGEVTDTDIADEVISLTSDTRKASTVAARQALVEAVFALGVYSPEQVQAFASHSDLVIRRAADAPAPTAPPVKGVLNRKGFPQRTSSFKQYVADCDHAGIGTVGALGLFTVDARFSMQDREYARQHFIAILSDCPEYADQVPDQVWAGMNRLKDTPNLSYDLCEVLSRSGSQSARRFASRCLVRSAGLSSVF